MKTPSFGKSATRALLVAFFGLIFTQPALSSYKYVGNKCRYYSEGDTTSICQGKRIPRNKTRGRSRARLSCHGEGQSKARQPQPIENYYDWADAVDFEGQKSQTAFELRQQQPLIKWSGSIQYSVQENWTWQSCEEVRSAAKCGTHEVCTTSTETYTTCDSENNCTTSSRPVTNCTNYANSCHVDVTRNASQYCSSPTIKYEAEYKRDASWNPSHPSYHNFLPNKYDLLPGEKEEVTITSTTSPSSIRPGVSFATPWNDYSVRISGSADGGRCAENTNYAMKVDIHTNHRLIKPSPNTFRLPVDAQGNPMDALVWETGRLDSGDRVKARPTQLRLIDTSAAMTSLMARDSRAGDDSKNPFYKNTVLKVALFEDAWFGDKAKSRPIVMSDSKAVATSELSMSDLIELKNSDYWIIPLDDSQKNANIYKRHKWLARMLKLKDYDLKPNQRYFLRISAYQTGVPFYLQYCEDTADQSNCTNNREKVFSVGLDYPFWTNDYDNRSWWEVLNEFTLVDWWHRNSRQRPSHEDNAQK